MHPFFRSCAEHNYSRDGHQQYSDFTRQVVRVWLMGQEDTPRRHLPGWNPNYYIGLEADVPRRDAVVAAFQVRAHASPFLRFPRLTSVSSTHG